MSRTSSSFFATPAPIFRGMFAAAVLLATPLRAQDAPGGADHPLLARYAGAQLNAYTQEEYVELEIVRRTPPPEGRSWGEPVGGKLSLINYLTPPQRTPLEVFRNYQSALKAGGFSTTYECELDGCRERRINGQGRYAGELIARRLSNKRAVSHPPSVEWTDNPSYFISAERQSPSGTVYVILFVTPGYAGSDQATVFQFVLEAKPMDDGLVTVNASAIRDALADAGHIALYGLTFATGSAELTPASAPQLEAMAELLRATPTLRVQLVGHTDNTGAFAANLALSKQRAEAVKDALDRTFGIAPDRLEAHGVASLAPVASNGTDEGRTRNRRVELVQR
jgi:outer membrane protein OmpA-like peptidoglycan-associated protein